MADINKETVKKLTKLSHIQCTEDEEESLLVDLQKILAYVEQLNAIDTDNVPPCNHVLEGMSNVEREDVAINSLERSVFLENAPDKKGGLIVVPPVIKPSS